MASPMDLSTFALPIVGHDLPPELGHNGLRFRGEVIPYTSIERFACSDNEVVVTFHADAETGEQREALVFEVDPESVHQVYNSLSQIIYKHMRQKGIAKYAEDDVDRVEIINAPIVDTKRISSKNRGW